MSDIAKELSVGLRAAGIYLLVLALPFTYFVGPLIADALTDTEVTKDLALSTLIWIPLAVAGLAPFLLCRATFDGLQEPRPSLMASAFRTIVLVIPMVWLGTKYHDALGLSTIAAACVAFVIGATVSGLVFFFFTRRRCSEMRLSA